MKPAEISPYEFFRYGDCVYMVQAHDRGETYVTHVATFYRKALNPQFDDDTWVPTHSTLIEKFDPDTLVESVELRPVVMITPKN